MLLANLPTHSHHPNFGNISHTSTSPATNFYLRQSTTTDRTNP
jgi:hypothetical protein